MKYLPGVGLAGIELYWLQNYNTIAPEGAIMWGAFLVGGFIAADWLLSKW
jgi:hypothetical protein